MAANQAFPPTAPDVCELKTLPAGMLLKSEGRGDYFTAANGLFRPLFNYISAHKIAMTTPVEAQIEHAAMYFWVAETEKPFRAVRLPDGMTVTATPSGEQRIRFDTTGLADPVVLSIAYQGLRRTVTVDAGGGVALGG